MKLTIEIHDVTPAAREEVRAIQQALCAIGVARSTLLVVPAFQDERGAVWDLRADPEMVRWLGREQRLGSEIVLHGLTHRAPRKPPPGARHWMMHHWFSRGSAEFAHLARAEAEERIERGRRILEECGLESRGFIAPAWQQSEEAFAAVAGAGFEFTAFMQHVVAFAPERMRVCTPVLTFAAANATIDYGKRAYMRALEARSKNRAMIRVALHPEDVRGSRPLDHAMRRIRSLLKEREHTTYREWLR